MKVVSVEDRAAWRVWLSSNHANEREIWLLFYKKASGRSSISYDDAVEEALCYGWIDSVIRRVDEYSYAQRFTPREPGVSGRPPTLRGCAG